MIVFQSQGVWLENEENSIKFALNADDFNELGQENIPVIGYVALGLSGERLSRIEAHENFMNEVWQMVTNGTAGDWDYPAQVLRYLEEDITKLRIQNAELKAKNAELWRMVGERTGNA